MATMQRTPAVGEWFEAEDGHLFEIVAFDATQAVVEAQHYDGTVEEFDLETWFALDLLPAEAPEDWSGSLDLEREDYGVDRDRPARAQPMNVLDELDREF